jgi:hypothetical protein
MREDFDQQEWEFRSEDRNLLHQRMPEPSTYSGTSEPPCAGAGVNAVVMGVPVTDSASATAFRFLGSPTVHVNGIDIEPEARIVASFGLACRSYCEGSVRQGVPPASLIRNALDEHLT